MLTTALDTTASWIGVRKYKNGAGESAFEKFAMYALSACQCLV